ncbi:MAG: hydrogen peroxide-inducible genes activator [Acidobacteriia bacterium]|nr:hydrogen peroxide-inducible genes activator [Methyloceanibacter sp.]MCL6491206.1 hydrogen peroxide-inducible genes activator [Terriglobia bacterium]
MIYLPSLQQLRFLAAIAEHRHFGRAASACAVTQSTLSAGIQELEKRLGVVLVERSRRGVNLTPLGAEVAARGQRLLRDAKDLLELVQSAREPLVGPLRLGVIPTIGPYLVPAMMPGLVQKFPKLQLYLREEQTAPLLEKLAADQLDVVALALPYDVSRLEVMELAEDPLFVVLPRTHPLAEASRIKRDWLADQNLLLLEDGHCLRRHALEACRFSGPAQNEVFQGTSLRTVIQMAVGGLGVTLAPRLALPTELPPDGSLLARPLDAEAPPRRIALAWRASAVRKEDFRLLGDFMKSVLASILRTPLRQSPVAPLPSAQAMTKRSVKV